VGKAEEIKTQLPDKPLDLDEEDVSYTS